MTKNALNQNTKFVQELLRTIENNFVFATSPIDRLKQNKSFELNNSQKKAKKLLDLKNKINSIQNCNLKDNSKNIVMGDGEINSPLMLVGEAPGEKEDLESLNFPFPSLTYNLSFKLLSYLEKDFPPDDT